MDAQGYCIEVTELNLLQNYYRRQQIEEFYGGMSLSNNIVKTLHQKPGAVISRAKNHISPYFTKMVINLLKQILVISLKLLGNLFECDWREREF